MLLSACAQPTRNTMQNTNTAQINGNTEIIPEPVEYTHAVYKTNITAECISNDSVGDDWGFAYIMDGQEIKSGHQVIIPMIGEAQTKMITATVKERDKMPDVATEEVTFEIRGGEEKRRRLTVTENNGRAKDRCAVWDITVSVEFIENRKEQL